MPSIRHAVAARALACCLICVFTPRAGAAAAAQKPDRPQAFDAVYSVKAGGIAVGRMTRHLEYGADDHYLFSSIVEAQGLVALLKPTRIAEESRGTWRGDYPLTRHYTYSKKSGRKRKETAIDFDWSGGLTHATSNGAAFDAALAPGTIDKLSYQLALMRDLKAGVTTLAYQVADVGGSKQQTLERLPDVQIEAGGKTWDTVPVVYARDDGRRTVLWCTPALDYMPVRIEYTEKDGAVTTAELTSPPP